MPIIRKIRLILLDDVLGIVGLSRQCLLAEARNQNLQILSPSSWEDRGKHARYQVYMQANELIIEGRYLHQQDTFIARRVIAAG